MAVFIKGSIKLYNYNFYLSIFLLTKSLYLVFSVFFLLIGCYVMYITSFASYFLGKKCRFLSFSFKILSTF